MKLVIVESPTKEKTIVKYLGKDYKVMASYGHVRDLAKTGKYNLGVNIDGDFEATYEVSPTRLNVIKRLQKVAKEADEVILATDPDREGEAISWHLCKVLELDEKTTKRLAFNEITPYGINNALEAPRTLDLDIVSSQETRRIMDRIIGFRLSYLMQQKVKSPSAGRVQSAVLKIIVDREKEIESFEPKEYYTVSANLSQNDVTLKADLVRVDGEDVKINSKEECDAILARVNQKGIVSKSDKESIKSYPRPPFTTSSLQQAAFATYGFSTKKTMQVAQTLYEGVEINNRRQGIITYMRTDSIRLSPQFINQAKAVIVEDFGSDYVGKAYSAKSGENIQDAHEAIRPTNPSFRPNEIEEYLTPDQFKLYSLIYARALSSMMSPKELVQSTVVVESNGVEFETVGNKVVFDGYLKLYGKYEKETKDEEFNFELGKEALIQKVTPKQKFTKAPSRYNEGQLVRKMEESGIGRPSTYVATIENIKTKKYVSVKGGYLTPTEQGKITIEQLDLFFPKLISIPYTAYLETKLDEIEEGHADELSILKELNGEFEVDFKKALVEMEKAPDKETGLVCPKCGKELVYRSGKYGEFMACSGYPECKYIHQEEKKVPENAKVCPKCGKGHLVVRRSKYGSFLACNQYPSCDYMEKLNYYKKKG